MPKFLFDPSSPPRRILLLQGPVGPFFWNLHKELLKNGHSVNKINFNGGDCLFYPKHAELFKQPLSELRPFIIEQIQAKQIDTIVLFGDCRPIHIIAKHLARDLMLNIVVFEEGYLRPNHITIEEFGVNGNSIIPRSPAFFLEQEDLKLQPVTEVGNTFWHAAIWAGLYYISSSVLSPMFKFYEHHRPLSVTEGWPWLKGVYRKLIFKRDEKEITRHLFEDLSKRFYLVPLQVYNDAQVVYHSDFESVEVFIRHVISSFSKHAPAHTYLVIKQHPFDRGYNEYSEIIKTLAKAHQVEGRVMYIHDQYLPFLLANALGVVTINSTVGLSAIHHRTATIACGDALYDIPELTFTGTLDEFWSAAPHHQINHELYEKFTAYLEIHHQINGSFYRKIPKMTSPTGLQLDLNNKA